MQTVLDYLKKNKRYEHDFEGRAFTLELQGDIIWFECNGDGVLIEANQKGWAIENEIRATLEDYYGIEIRFCEECGKPFDAGFMAGDGDWYCCEECFDDAMDKTYGEGKWRPTDEEGEYGGFYESFDGNVWEDTSVYYTEWY